MAVCGLYEPVESVARGHVAEGGSGRGVELPALGQRHDLAQLASRDVVAWAELEAPGPATIAGYDASVIGGLHKPVERVSGKHVAERGSGRVVQKPTLRQRHYLCQL